MNRIAASRQSIKSRLAASSRRAYVAPPPGPGTRAPPPPSSGGASPTVWIVVAGVAAGGVYYCYTSSKSNAPCTKSGRKADAAQADFKRGLDHTADAAQAKLQELQASAKEAGKDIQDTAADWEAAAKKQWEQTKDSANETWDSVLNRAQSAYNEARHKAGKESAEVKAQAENVYAKIVGSGAELSGSLKSQLDSEYAKSKARYAEHKGEKAAEASKGWFSWLTGK